LERECNPPAGGKKVKKVRDSKPRKGEEKAEGRVDQRGTSLGEPEKGLEGGKGKEQQNATWFVGFHPKKKPECYKRRMTRVSKKGKKEGGQEFADWQEGKKSERGGTWRSPPGPDWGEISKKQGSEGRNEKDDRRQITW